MSVGIDIQVSELDIFLVIVERGKFLQKDDVKIVNFFGLKEVSVTKKMFTNFNQNFDWYILICMGFSSAILNMKVMRYEQISRHDLSKAMQ